MIRSVLCWFLFTAQALSAQELYVFSDPASNIPARSVNVKLKTHGVGTDMIFGRNAYRVMPQVMAGLTKKIQLRFSASASNMHTKSLETESINLGAKYRFLSLDGIHQHFRMATYVDGSITRIPFHYEEITLMGDKTGVEVGLIATQLWHKLAVSGTVSRTEVLDKSRNDGLVYFPKRQYQSLNYSLSAGYLLLPREYKNYKQPNLNIYVELLGQRLIGTDLNYIDLAPALQLILNSRIKVNVGRRYQLQGNMQRMASQSWLFSVETSFLQVWK
ncbi:MAG: hypothetical protein FJX92_06605 [Bacteroidetes bacterium]|nr:hypothetical protein [Bacteroidota bacterium]